MAGAFPAASGVECDAARAPGDRSGPNGFDRCAPGSGAGGWIYGAKNGSGGDALSGPRPAVTFGTPGQALGVWGSEATMAEMFGPAGGADCTAGRVPVPWPMVAAWDQSQRIRTIACHRKVAVSLGRVLEAVADTYAQDEIRALGLHLYGGCYNLRKKRGGADLSTHAYGLALDWDPLRNRLKWDANRARLAKPDAVAFWECFEAEGWTSLGRSANFDWMHVQAPHP